MMTMRQLVQDMIILVLHTCKHGCSPRHELCFQCSLDQLLQALLQASTVIYMQLGQVVNRHRLTTR
jgi:hypothetical protein